MPAAIRRFAGERDIYINTYIYIERDRESEREKREEKAIVSPLVFFLIFSASKVKQKMYKVLSQIIVCAILFHQ